MQFGKRPGRGLRHLARSSARGISAPSLYLFAGLLGLAACDSSAATRVESQHLLASYEALTAAVGDQSREAKLAALEAMPLRQEITKQARTLCVEAHRALLKAEQQQEQAARMLEQAIEGKEGAPLATAEIAPIQATIERSETALGAARASFVTCEDAMRDLSLHYGAGGEGR